MGWMKERKKKYLILNEAMIIWKVIL